MIPTDKFIDNVGRKIDVIRSKPGASVYEMLFCRTIEEVLVPEIVKLFKTLETNEIFISESSQSN